MSVHWIDWGESPMSAFGPMQAMWAPSDLWVIRGGSVIQKTGWHPFSFGRSEFIARWAQHHLGVPVLYTVVGTGVQEPATTMWFADDVWVTGISAAYNAEGNRQLEPVVRRSAGDVDLEVHTIYLSTDRFVDRDSGCSAHLTNAICPLDIDKVLVYPSGDRRRHARVAQAQGLQGRRGRGPRGADPLHAHQHDPARAGRDLHGQGGQAGASRRCARPVSR